MSHRAGRRKWIGYRWLGFRAGSQRLGRICRRRRIPKVHHQLIKGITYQGLLSPSFPCVEKSPMSLKTHTFIHRDDHVNHQNPIPSNTRPARPETRMFPTNPFIHLMQANHMLHLRNLAFRVDDITGEIMYVSQVIAIQVYLIGTDACTEVA